MLTTTKVHDIEAVEINAEDVQEILESRQAGVCRAILLPEAASLLLTQFNANNRGIKRHQREFIKVQVQENRFLYNGETIVIGDNRQVMNGQHRLSACVAADMPIEVLIVFGVPSKVFVTIDQGSRRNGADVLTIKGQQNCSCLAAALRQIDNYFHDCIGQPHASGRTVDRHDNAKSLELLEKYPGVQHSVSMMVHCRLTPPGLAAALNYLFRMVDETDADEFCGVVMNGVQTDATYSQVGKAAGLLREWLMRAAIGSKKMPARYIANVWIKAWNAGRTGVFPKILVYKDGEGQVLIK
jgi:hypothetical protein